MYLSGKYVPEHHKIAPQTIKRVNESGWFIFFKKEMPEPRKTVSAKRNDDEPKPFTGNDSEDDTNKNQQSAGEVKRPAHRVLMLR